MLYNYILVGGNDFLAFSADENVYNGLNEWECLVLPVALGGLLVALGSLPLYFLSWSGSPFTVHVYIISKTDFYICFFNILEKYFIINKLNCPIIRETAPHP